MNTFNKITNFALVALILRLFIGNCAAQPVDAKTNSTEAILEIAAQKPSAPLEDVGWQPLFDGQTLKGWKVTDFTGHGPAYVKDGLLVIEPGDALSGVTWTNTFTNMNFEIALDAMRVKGGDFFCGLTFPVADSYCSLIIDGWGGTVVGLSSIDGQDASENETVQFRNFDSQRWYRVRVRVTDAKIEAWLDDEKIVDLKTAKRAIGLRWGEIEFSKPLGLATYQTRGAMRNIKFRVLDSEAKK